MRIASSDALWVALAPGQPAEVARAARPDASIASAGDSPDQSYWTPYDYFMIEREARVLRRNALIDTLTALARRFRKLM